MFKQIKWKLGKLKYNIINELLDTFIIIKFFCTLAIIFSPLFFLAGSFHNDNYLTHFIISIPISYVVFKSILRK